jgi:hypothetical protein
MAVETGGRLNDNLPQNVGGFVCEDIYIIINTQTLKRKEWEKARRLTIESSIVVANHGETIE